MITCLIVDDESHAVKNLLYCVEKVPSLHLVAATTDPLEALSIVQTQNIDLIFLDIQMPDITGLDFIRTIKERSRVILTTAYSEFALDGFDLDVIDYLLKPITLPRFLQALEKAKEVIGAKAALESLVPEPVTSDFFFVKTEVKGKMLKIDFADIDFIENLKNYVAIHYNGRKILALQSMKEVDSRLPKSRFMRVHRSFIIPLANITGIEGNTIRLKNVDREVLIGETYKAAFLERMKGTII